MKEYKDIPEQEPLLVSDVAVAYEVAQPRLYPVGHTLLAFSAELDRRLSEHYGVNFGKVTQMIDSGKLKLSDVNDGLLSRPEFQY